VPINRSQRNGLTCLHITRRQAPHDLPGTGRRLGGDFESAGRPHLRGLSLLSVGAEDGPNMCFVYLPDVSLKLLREFSEPVPVVVLNSEVSKRWFRVRDTYGDRGRTRPGRRTDPRRHRLHRYDADHRPRERRRALCGINLARPSSAARRCGHLRPRSRI
jgi:hypothetical protein